MAGGMSLGDSGSRRGRGCWGASGGLGLLAQVWGPQSVVGRRGTCPDSGVHRYPVDTVGGGGGRVGARGPGQRQLHWSRSWEGSGRVKRGEDTLMWEPWDGLFGQSQVHSFNPGEQLPGSILASTPREGRATNPVLATHLPMSSSV